MCVDRESGLINEMQYSPPSIENVELTMSQMKRESAKSEVSSRVSAPTVVSQSSHLSDLTREEIEEYQPKLQLSTEFCVWSCAPFVLSCVVERKIKNECRSLDRDDRMDEFHFFQMHLFASDDGCSDVSESELDYAH